MLNVNLAEGVLKGLEEILQLSGRPSEEIRIADGRRTRDGEPLQKSNEFYLTGLLFFNNIGSKNGG